MVLFKIIKGTSQARDLEKRLPEGRLPAFALLDEKRNVAAWWRGYSNPDDFVATLRRHLKRPGK